MFLEKGFREIKPFSRQKVKRHNCLDYSIQEIAVNCTQYICLLCCFQEQNVP